MYFEADTLDDLMWKVFKELEKRPFDIFPTRSNGNNPTSEIIGATLKLKNPRARLSISETRGRPFSALGELLWYLSGKNDLEFIQYFIEDYKKEADENKMIYSGYGPRLFNLRGQVNQIQNIINLLKDNPSTRRAVIQIFDGIDIGHKEIPCTCTLQFLLRDNHLSMVVFMRSNDAFKGLPHDVFAFTMFQEIIAKSIGSELGEYVHSVGSLHLYENNLQSISNYFKEGYQSTKFAMPAMTDSNVWDEIKKLQSAEALIRKDMPIDLADMDPYWADIARLLNIFHLHKKGDINSIRDIERQMNSKTYKSYIEKKIYV